MTVSIPNFVKIMEVKWYSVNTIKTYNSVVKITEGYFNKPLVRVPQCLVTRHLQISTQMARLGIGRSIRLVYQIGSDRNSAHGSIHESHPVQKQSRSLCPV